MDYIIMGIARVLDIVLEIAKWTIIIRALISWVNPDPYNPIVQALVRVTEPILAPIRKVVSPYKIGIDLSPLIAILILVFLDYALVKNLYRFGSHLG